MSVRPGCRRRGLVVLGDSLSTGGGHRFHGLPMRSWASWVATSLQLPFTNLAVGGATTAHALHVQAPRLRGPYDVGCIYIGTNDVVNPRFVASDYEFELGNLAAAVRAQAKCVVMVTIPRRAGRSRYFLHARQATEIVRRIAGEQNATVVDLTDLRGWLRVQPDAVHLTALGQLELGQRAATALAVGGLPVAQMPVELAQSRITWRGCLRYALTCHLPLLMADLVRRPLHRGFYKRASPRVSP
jgi:lysophospholipase L1-like esterase